MIMNLRNRVHVVWACLILLNQAALAQDFTPTEAPSQNWLSLASSADGNKLAGVGSYGLLYVSTNSGLSWQAVATALTGPEPSRPWAAISSSADGNKLAAVANNNSIFISTNSGATWNASGPALNWSAIAASSDGSKIAVANYDMGRIHTSSDGGATWVTTASPAKRWRSLTSSANGRILFAGSDYGTNYGNLPAIYKSADAGVSWQATTAPHQPWQTIAVSADGTKVAAGVYGGLIYFSSDSGASWSPASVPSMRWGSIASSADGVRLAAAAWEGAIYVSADSGRTWSQASAPDQQWQAVASSADGIKLAAGIYNMASGGIYTAIAPPTLSISVLGEKVVLTWPASATGFVIQEAVDLVQPNWVDVSSGSLVNGANQVSVPKVAGGGFFRLVQRGTPKESQ